MTVCSYVEACYHSQHLKRVKYSNVSGRVSERRVLYVFQYELATGRFPYPKWNSVFDQLTQVVRGEPPQLSNSDERRFSPKFISFVNVW